MATYPAASEDKTITATEEIERSVAALWQEVLQTTEPPRATDDFFALGGDSMAMVTLEFRIKEDLSVDLPPGAILGAPTLRELSTLVAAAFPAQAYSDDN